MCGGAATVCLRASAHQVAAVPPASPALGVTSSTPDPVKGGHGDHLFARDEEVGLRWLFSSAYSDGLVAASRDPHLVERGRVSGALFAWASPHQASLRGFRPVEQEALPADGRYPDPGSGRQFRRVAE